jgi:hypothetical protein
VTPVCSAGERLCADGLTCSLAGACTLDLALDAQLSQVNEEDNAETPPALTLRAAPGLSRYMEVRRFSVFAACAPGVMPKEDAPCELGADATDFSGVDLSPAVLACPPVECLTTGCPGHQFAAKGLRGCLDTAAPVGTVFEVAFWVFDQQSPARNATATRTVVVVEPCAPGLEYCTVDSKCGITACSVREALQAEALSRRRRNRKGGFASGDLIPPNLTLAVHELTLDYLTASPIALTACADGAQGVYVCVCMCVCVATAERSAEASADY